MRRLVVIALVVVALPGTVAAQSWGQSWGQPRHGGVSTAPYGQPPAGAFAEGHGSAYGYAGQGQTYGHGPVSGFGDPRAWRPPVRYGHGHDRGGRYGYSPARTGDWIRWSSPPGRGYHEVYGYNDDRAPRGPDHRRHRSVDCPCGDGVYLYDR
jgi:hypothetical protein